MSKYNNKGIKREEKKYIVYGGGTKLHVEINESGDKRKHAECIYM